MTAYYNEIDPAAAHLLRALIADGVIAPGDVDERSIVDVRPDDLKGYAQCHFFAGGGLWSVALRMAGWPDDEPVWTGSCPCQPLSSAGRRKGHADERHLWPAFYRLIAERRPTVCLGEQVASKDGLEWLSAVRSDLEDAGYAVGAANLPIGAVGAPSERSRLYWVANATGARGWRREALDEWHSEESRRSSSDFCFEAWPDHSGSGSTLVVSDILLPSYGVPGRVAALRVTGNAISPQVAARFIEAVAAK